MFELANHSLRAGNTDLIQIQRAPPQIRQDPPLLVSFVTVRAQVSSQPVWL